MAIDEWECVCSQNSIRIPHSTPRPTACPPQSATEHLKLMSIYRISREQRTGQKTMLWQHQRHPCDKGLRRLRHLGAVRCSYSITARYAKEVTIGYTGITVVALRTLIPQNPYSTEFCSLVRRASAQFSPRASGIVHHTLAF